MEFQIKVITSLGVVTYSLYGILFFLMLERKGKSCEMNSWSLILVK